MKIDRLMGILLHLLKHGRTSSAQLAVCFEVNPRTILRDIDTLCQAGIPIRAICGVNGGYEILDTYVMDKQILKQQEYQQIISALYTMASAYENQKIQETIEKIVLLSGEMESSIKIDLSVAHENVNTNERIRVLEGAIEKTKSVQFVYTNNANERKVMLVEPVGVVYKWYNWYLIGYNIKHNDYRMYKLVRMESVDVTDQNISMKHSLKDVMERWVDTQKQIEILAKGEASVRAKCKEYLNIKIVKEYENGDFEFQITVPEQETFWLGVILSLGAKVQVLSPVHIINRIMNVCTEVIQLYQ